VDFLRALVPSCSNAATFQFNIDRDGFLPCLNKVDRQKYEGCLQWSSDAVRPNLGHFGVVRRDRFMRPCSQLGRSGPAWLLTILASLGGDNLRQMQFHYQARYRWLRPRQQRWLGSHVPAEIILSE
jgi:hypothetical protein